jgi:WD40 repeat protein/uncharacterized caspase-like protein
MKTIISTVLLIFTAGLLLAQLPAAETVIQNTHTGLITAMEFSPDGRYIVTAGSDKTIRIWTKAGILVRTINVEFKISADVNIMKIIFTKDGKSFYTYDEKQSELCHYKTDGTFIGQVKSGFSIRDIAISPDENRMVASNYTSSGITIIDLNCKEDIKLTTPNNCFNVAWLNDDQIYGLGYNNLTVWNAKGDTLRTVKFKYGVDHMILSHDKKNIFFAFKERSNISADISRYDAEKITFDRKFEGNAKDQSVRTSVSKNGNFVAVIDNISELTLWNSDGQLVSRKRLSKGYFQNAEVMFSPDDNSLLVTLGSSLLIYDLELNETGVIGASTKYADYAAFSIEGSEIVTKYDNELKFKSFDGKVLRTVDVSMDDEDHKQSYVKIWLSPKQKYIAVAENTRGFLSNIYFYIKDINGKTVAEFPRLEEFSSTILEHIQFSRDEKLLIATTEKGAFVYDLVKKKKIADLKGHTETVNYSAFNKSGQIIATASTDNTVKLWKPDGTMIRSFNIECFPSGLVFTPDEKSIIIGQNVGSVIKLNIENGKIIELIGSDFSSYYGDFTNYIAISPDGLNIASANAYGQIRIVSVDGKRKKELEGHTQMILSVNYSPDGKFLITSSSDDTVRVWNIETGEYVTYLESGSEWIMFNKEGYFDGSKNLNDFIRMTRGMTPYAIDQLALRNNRPDILLTKLGLADLKNNKIQSKKTKISENKIDHYLGQYRKRLRKSGLTEDQLSPDYHVPTVNITDMQVSQKSAILNFQLTDSISNLWKYNIYVNDVPLFGAYGKEIGGNSVSLSENIELTTGSNKIEVTCLNENGAESFRALTYAKYEGKTPSDLYYIAFGVSQYKNSSLNLKYADKDAKDLSEVFSKQKISQFADVHIKTFTNEEVTVANIKSAKEFLKNSKPDDTFILFIAGHGVHDTDKEATYYYLTHETDLDDLPNTAANFDIIEDILQGIPPRNKLFLMDTCESGEIEDGVQNAYYASADSRGFNGRGIRITEKASTAPVKPEKRTYLFEKDRYIYNDLARRSGAIVFSSSKGGELSYEKDELQNGLFTEEIINCLTGSGSDTDKDGIVSTDELRDFVSKAVSAKTNGLQNPTVDRDNIYQKFGFRVQ